MDFKEIVAKAQKKFNNKEFVEALILLKEAREMAPEDIQLLYFETYSFFKTGDFEKAISGFDLLIQNQPHNASFYSERGLVFMNQQSKEKAIKDFDKALELEPLNPYRYSSRAFVKDFFGDAASALLDYDEAIKLDPEDAVSYNNRGIIQEKLGYKDKANESYKKADDLSQPEEGSEKKQSTTLSTPEVSLSKQDIKPTKKKLISYKAYISVLKRLVTDKEERKGFKSFVKKFLKGN